MNQALIERMERAAAANDITKLLDNEMCRFRTGQRVRIRYDGREGYVMGSSNSRWHCTIMFDDDTVGLFHLSAIDEI